MAFGSKPGSGTAWDPDSQGQFLMLTRIFIYPYLLPLIPRLWMTPRAGPSLTQPRTARRKPRCAPCVSPTKIGAHEYLVGSLYRYLPYLGITVTSLIQRGFGAAAKFSCVWTMIVLDAQVVGTYPPTYWIYGTVPVPNCEIIYVGR